MAIDRVCRITHFWKATRAIVRTIENAMTISPTVLFSTGRGMQQPFARLEEQERRRAADERGLTETGERLRLAVAEAMLVIGRHRRLADGDAG